MEAILILGVLAFIYSIIYLIYHFIQKIRYREKPLSKKIFFPFFIGGLILTIFGASFADNGSQAKLNSALEKNAKIAQANKDLKASNSLMQKEIKKLKSDVNDLSKKVADSSNANQQLKDQQSEFQKEKDDLNKQISDLTSKNTDLQNQVNSLNSQLASNSTTPQTSSNTTTASVPTSGGTEIFANCTQLRAKYPNGVPQGHPAYNPALDRDKDGFACER